jgi:zinc/manganese transport system permease protein
VLLVFALLVGPAAAALRLTTHVARGILLSVALALAETWLGIALAYVTDWPATFWIVLSSSAVYLGALAHSARGR